MQYNCLLGRKMHSTDGVWAVEPIFQANCYAFEEVLILQREDLFIVFQ